MPTLNDIINIGFNFQQDGKFDEAERAYTEALSINCENADLCNLMGVLKLQQNDITSAIEWSEKAIKINPSEYFYETLFQTYIRAGLYDRIIACKNDAEEKFSKSFPIMFNIALAYKNLKQNHEAIKYYDKALKINPSSYKAWFNLAHIYAVEGMCKNALSAYKVCNKLKPKDADTEYFLSTAMMRVKDYKNGLKLFENRLSKDTAVSIQRKSYPTLASEEKLWKGENIKNKRIFVYYEGGFGDTIMFSRYLPLLKKCCKEIIFYPQKQLIPLYTESGLGIDELIDGYIPEKNMNFDVHTPILSLPYLLGLRGDKVFEASEGYIAANPELTNTYKEKYFNNDKIKIGIKWQGNTYCDQDRVIPAEKFLSLINVENTQFYSFQTFEGSEKIKELADKTSIIDISNDFVDFGHTAAALENLDLVICNDTSLAHLAGAMGKPCFVILPYEVNWRWHEDLSHCDWYDSIKLFRQKSIGDWDGVFEEIQHGLETAIKRIEK